MNEQPSKHDHPKILIIAAVIAILAIVVVGGIVVQQRGSRQAADSAATAGTTAGTETTAEPAANTEAAEDADSDTNDVLEAFAIEWLETDMAALDRANNSPYSYLTSDPNDVGEADREVSLDDADLPAQFDLRDYGLVTPVKLQNPWGDCYAFAEIAASETSILSAMGKTYEETGLDLSERQLAWFVYGQVPESAGDHAGEGTYYASEVADPNMRLDQGGFASFAVELFSSGVGPLDESKVPYKNEEEYVHCYIWPDPDSDDYYTAGLTMDEVETLRTAGMYIEVEGYATTMDTVDPETGEVTSSAPATWAVDDSYWGQSDYVLCESNVLPEYCVYDENGDYVRTDENAIIASKQELLDGHAIAVSIKADTARPSDEANHYYYDEEHDALYHNEVIECDHEVTIVGWDDNYSKENFGNGDASLQPPEDGAWIIKNSWGAETEEFPNHGYYGIKNEDGLSTGYLYVSYWDQCILTPQTYDYDLDAPSNTDATIYQYTYRVSDMTPAIVSSEEPTAEANVYIADGDSTIYALSCETTHVNTEVTYQIYLVDEDCADPFDGELVLEVSETYPYGGYHRVELAEDEQLEVADGQGFAVVVVQYCPDNGLYYQSVARDAQYHSEEAEEELDQVIEQAILNYYQSTYSALYDKYLADGLDEDAADEKADAGAWEYIDREDIQEELTNLVLRTADSSNFIVYDATVNPGESWIYKGDLEADDGAWADWSDVVQTMETALEDSDATMIYDNFPIKVYAADTSAAS